MSDTSYLCNLQYLKRYLIKLYLSKKYLGTTHRIKNNLFLVYIEQQKRIAGVCVNKCLVSISEIDHVFPRVRETGKQDQKITISGQCFPKDLSQGRTNVRIIHKSIWALNMYLFCKKNVKRRLSWEMFNRI